VQNSLRLHFGMPLSDGRGFAPVAYRDKDWRQQVFETDCGVLLVPFGSLSNAESIEFETFLARHPGWLADRVKLFCETPDVLVLIDLPPGPSVYLDAVADLEDLHIAVLLSDATSIALLPKVESGEFFIGTGRRAGAPVRYLLNQVDIRRRLSRDVLTVMRARLRERLIGAIYRDESVPEAIASQQLVSDFAPESKASQDFAEIAQRINGLLLGNTERSMTARLAT
jgi:cellulose synthase operon protein YhjQ